jgi:serine/threonine protein phosphatase PrpC
MESAFPSIKSTSRIPIPFIRPNPSQREIDKSKQPHFKYIPHRKNPFISTEKKTLQNYSKLPPISSNKESSFNSPVIPDLFAKFQAKKRTLSNSILHIEPKNVVSKFFCKTKTGSIMSVPKDQNQDSYIIQTSLQGIKGNYLFAVCDGHGTEGHNVSRLIKTFLNSVLENKLIRLPPIDAIKYAIDEVNEKVLHSRINSNFSGSTLVSVLILGDHLICANVGDSRAVIGNDLNNWFALEISKDHKPNRKDESEKIVAAGGRIDTHENGGPLRIYFKDQNLPGLAMTRSIGDKISREIGLTAVPEIIEKKLTINDRFIIIASDGLWEFISSREAVEIVSKYWQQGQSDICCEKLLKESVNRWNNNSVSVDDITIIVIFLDIQP